MTINNNPKPTESKTSSNLSCINPIVFVILIGWIAAVTYLRHNIVFGTTFDPGPTTRIAAIASTVLGGILLAAPIFPMALWWPDPRFRSIYQAWALTGSLMLLFLPIQLLELTAAQSQAVIHILLTLLYIAIIAILIRVRQNRQRKAEPMAQSQLNSINPNQWLFVLIISSILAYPWLAIGAFGSLLDTILQLTFALVLGMAASVILDVFIFQEIRASQNIPLKHFFTVGLASSSLLLILANSTSYGYNGMQILLMLVLPGLGWILTAHQMILKQQATGSQKEIGHTVSQNKNQYFSWQSIKNTLPYSVLIGLVAAAPSTLIDPDELVLISSSSAGEILGKAYLAAAISIGTALFAALILLVILLIIRSKAIPPLNSNFPLGSAALVTLTLLVGGTAIAVHYSTGQPGFYGERIFVYLDSQADLSKISQINDYPKRRQAVYETLIEHAETTQSKLRQDLDRLGIKYTPYYLVNAIEVSSNPFVRLWLNTRPEVDRVLESPRLRPLPEQPPISTGWLRPPADTGWNITLIQAERVWEELDVHGENIVVGQSDSGAQADHTELAMSYRGANGNHNYNWLDPWNNSLSPIDIGGHGTHTLGSIVGKTTGVAPGATWYACVNLARNLGNPALYLDCMQFMLAPYPLDGDPFSDGNPMLGAHIINNSWGCPEIEGCDSNTFIYAIRALRAAGVFVVASAGNDGPACSTLNTPPPIYPEAFAVGAIDKFGNLANFSSIGPVTVDNHSIIKPDIVAPGVMVLSSLPGNTYGEYSGTSMAGPHVVGVVALMWSANPSLIGDIDLTEQILTETADPYMGFLPDCPGAKSHPSTAVGYGIVNAYKAVRMAIESK